MTDLMILNTGSGSACAGRRALGLRASRPTARSPRPEALIGRVAVAFRDALRWDVLKRVI
jgi:hypothetical protein